MAVSAMACSVIVRNCTIAARFPGGASSFVSAVPNQTFCSDGTISRVGFMAETDARAFIGQLASRGIASSVEEIHSQIALVIQGHGFSYPCEWLQLGLFNGRPCAWLSGTDRGQLFIPQAELDADLTPPIKYEELRRSHELIGLRDNGKVEVYRHRETGKLIYVGRPFAPAKKNPWWRFWRG